MTTPAVAAGIADDRWTVEQLVERTAGYNPPKPTEWESFLDTLPDEELAMRFTIRELMLFTLATVMTAAWAFEHYAALHHRKVNGPHLSESQLREKWVTAEIRSSDLEAQIEYVDELIAKKGMRLVWSCGKPLKVESKNRYALAN